MTVTGAVPQSPLRFRHTVSRYSRAVTPSNLEGLLIYDENTGQASFVEFFPASGNGLNGPGQANITEGVGTIELGADGLPTLASLQNTMQEVLHDQGVHGAFGVILPGLNAANALAAAKAIKQHPPNYNALGLWGGMNCSTFTNQVAGAGGVSAEGNLPDVSTSNLAATNPSFTDYNGAIFGVDPPQGPGPAVGPSDLAGGF